MYSGIRYSSFSCWFSFFLFAVLITVDSFHTVSAFNSDQAFDWKVFHRYFYEYVDKALVLDTNLVVRSVSSVYCSHIKPPVRDDQIIGLKMSELIVGRVSNEKEYMDAIISSLQNQITTRVETLDIEGSQYELETTPLIDVNGKIYGLRHAINNVIKNEPNEYLKILQSTSQTDSWKVLLDSITDYAIFATSIRYTIESWTDTCHRMYGYSEAEVLSKPLQILYDTLQNQQSSTTTAIRREYKHKNGELFVAEEQISPILSHGILVGYSVIVRDLSATKTQERLLLEAREQSQKVQTNFLSTISHESRSNTAIIISSIEILMEDTVLNEEQRELCEDIHQASKILLQVVEDILNYSSYMKNGVQLKNVPFQVRKSIEMVYKVQSRSLEIKYPKKQFPIPPVQLQLFIDKHLPNTIVGDEVRLSQIITNLMSNAIKFTEKGTVRLSVEICASKHKDTICLLISVSDDGVGIREEQQIQLFVPFYQADAGLARTETGTGLGLSNVKMIAEAMNGNVNVESQLGLGSTFSCTVYMYLYVENTQEHSETQQAFTHKRKYSLPVNLLNTRVLLVEDNPIMSKIAIRSFHQLGIKDIVWVNNGREAVFKCNIHFLGQPRDISDKFDIVFMDLMLPIMDGLEATRLIRVFDKATPIIALTSNALEEHRDMCLKAGMNWHMVKPISIKDLKDILLQFLPHGVSF